MIKICVCLLQILVVIMNALNFLTHSMILPKIPKHFLKRCLFYVKIIEKNRVKIFGQMYYDFLHQQE